MSKGIETKYVSAGRGVTVMMIVGVIATIVIAALMLQGYNGYTVNPYAWAATLIVPFIMTLSASAYYNTKPRYEDS